MKPNIDSINHEMSVNEVNVAQSNFIFFLSLTELSVIFYLYRQLAQ